VFYCSKKLAELESTVASLSRRSAQSSSSFTHHQHQANGGAVAASNTVDQYTLGAAKKDLKKLRDQLALNGR